MEANKPKFKIVKLDGELIKVHRTQVRTMTDAGFTPYRRRMMPSRIVWRREVFPGIVLFFALRLDSPLTAASLVRLIVKRSFYLCEENIKAHAIPVSWPNLWSTLSL
jgi:hypothetical protein